MQTIGLVLLFFLFLFSTVRGEQEERRQPLVPGSPTAFPHISREEEGAAGYELRAPPTTPSRRATSRRDNLASSSGQVSARRRHSNPPTGGRRGQEGHAHPPSLALATAGQTAPEVSGARRATRPLPLPLPRPLSLFAQPNGQNRSDTRTPEARRGVRMRPKAFFFPLRLPEGRESEGRLRSCYRLVLAGLSLLPSADSCGFLSVVVAGFPPPTPPTVRNYLVPQKHWRAFLSFPPRRLFWKCKRAGKGPNSHLGPAARTLVRTGGRLSAWMIYIFFSRY